MIAQDDQLATEDMYMDFLNVVLWRHMETVPVLWLQSPEHRFQGQ